MTWTNLGALGIGGLLMTVPIILHFLMQPKPKEIDFPALRFLQQRQKTTRSRMRLKHLLLLIMRCLLIGLLAVALAGPSVASSDFGNWLTLGGVGISGLLVGGIGLLAFLQPKRNPLFVGILGTLLLGHLLFGGYSLVKLLSSEDARLIGDDQAPVAALIVVDTSPRMQYRFENLTRLEKAQAFGQWLVGQLPADSQVCVAATDGDPPFFSVDVGAAGRRLEVLETSFVGPKLPTTLEDGLKILEKAPLERKEVYVLTDLTRESWVGEVSGTLAKRLKRDEDISLFIVDLGVPDPANFRLGELRLSSPEIAPAGTLTLDTQIVRRGAAAQRSVKMELEQIDPARPTVRDGEAVFPAGRYPAQTLNRDIRENGSADIQFTITRPLDVGTYHGTVAIEGVDGLSLDDQRYFTFRVSPARSVLVVHGEDVFFRPVVSLLAPEQFVRAGISRYRCDTIEVSSLRPDQTELADYRAVMLVDPGPLSDAQWEQLEAFVDAGGGLGIFLGHNASSNGQVDPSFLTDNAKRVIGGELDLIWYNETDDLFLSPDELSHPIFRPIEGLETSVLWNRFPIYQHWGLQPENGNQEYPTQTVLSYSNREPAIVERQIGQGRVLTMTTPISEPSYLEGRQSWNRLLTGKQLPWFYLMTGISSYLVQTDADSLNIQVGQTAVFENDLRANPEAYRVFSPDPNKPPTPLNSVDGRVRYRFNDQPGHYRFRGNFDGDVVLRGFSSNLSAGATDLARLRPDELDEILGAGRYQLATQQNEIQRQQGKTRRGQEFYPLVVVLMMVILAVEFLMSNRFYR